MIQIEKVKSNIKRGWSKPGIIDHFLSEYDKDKFHLGFLVKNCNLVWPTLKKQLENADIYVGLKYGTTGANIKQCLKDQSVYFEIGDYDIVHCMPKSDAINLLLNCNVIVHDYIEGGHYPTSDFYSWIKSLNITPKNLILHTSGFNFDNSDIPNTTVLPCSSFFALYTILQTDIFNILFDEDEKNDYIDYIKQQRSKDRFNYLSMIYNRKPRHNRLKFLANLSELEILDKCMWTLAWNNENSSTDWNQNGTVTQHQSLLNKHVQEDSVDKRIIKFLRKYQNKLPKNLTELEAIDPSSGTKYMKEWSGQSKWNCVIETFTIKDHPGYPNPVGFLTEKTFRSYLLGMPCLLVGPPGIYNELRRLGLPIYDESNDSLEAWEKVDHMSDFILNDYKNAICIEQHTDLLLTSLKEFWTLDNLCNIISKPLCDLPDLTS